MVTSRHCCLPVQFLVLLLAITGCGRREDIAWAAENKARVRQSLGFSLDSPYLEIDGDYQEVSLVIANLHPNGVLAEAGAKNGDIILKEKKFEPHYYVDVGFYRWLAANSGKEVTITVVAGGSGVPISQRDRRLLTFTVPPRTGKDSS